MGSIRCRVVEGGTCDITQGYKPGVHDGLDMVQSWGVAGYIMAHSDGTVVSCRKDYKTNDKTGNSYGNYVKIKHDDGYYTLYAHIAYGTVTVNNGQRVSKSQRLGFMGATGHASAVHLHWEVRNQADIRIDPSPYLDADLPNNTPSPIKYKVGDIVDINGVYVSSDSVDKLTPVITRGTITKIVEGARNPYLLDNGNIGWVNDGCIVNKPETKYKTVVNCYYLNLRNQPSYGNNIYTSVPAGTRLEYLGNENGWAKVKYDNRILYCGEGYLK